MPRTRHTSLRSRYNIIFRDDFIPDLPDFHNSMTHASTLITVAVTSEAGPLIRGLGLRRDRSLLRRRIVYTGRVGGRPIVLAVTGMGPSQASHVVDALQRRCGPGRVIISGTAGAVRPGLNTGDVIVPRCIIDTANDLQWQPTWHPPSPAEQEDDSLGEATSGVLHSGDTVVDTPAAKAKIAQRGADAVDMESAAIARVCDHYDVPWICIRAICDTAEMRLPAAAARLVDRRGRPRVIYAATYVILQPWQMRPLMRLGAAAKCAAAALVEPVATLISSGAG